MESFVPVLKDPENEHPVPTLWRPPLRAAANALKDGNYRLVGLQPVRPVDEETAAHIANYIRDYGRTLLPLPEESWETSVSSWQSDHWEVLVDLFTVEEGLSDLVLHVMVSEDEAGFRFEIHLVYVP